MQSKSRTLVFISVGLVLVAILGYLGFRALRRPAASAQGTAKMVQVSRGSIEVSVSGSGNVAFAEDVQIRSQVSGTVVKVLVKDGQKVEAGQPLFVLENDTLKLTKEKAQSNVEDLTRSVRELQEDIAALRVVAPQAGRVTNVAVSEGQRVNEGATLLTLVDDNTFSVTVPFLKPERDRIKVGDAAEVFLPDFLSSLQGKVVKVSQTSLPGSGGAVVYPVTVDFPNPGALEEGTSALVTVKTSQGPVEALEAGTIGFKKVAEIRSSVAGEVEKVEVEANDKVRAGQLLVELVNDELPSNLTRQEAALAQARMELANQESQMAKLTITAPISGVFRENEASSSNNNTSSIQGPVQVGDELKPNDPVGRIVNNSNYKVVVNIDELDISQVKVGQKAEITIDALPGQTVEGTVTQIAEEGVVQNGAAYYPVTLTLPPTPGLKAGMTANARILVAKKDDALLLPVEAVQERNGRFFVVLPADTNSASMEQGTRRQMKEIKVGLYNETFVEVLEGLKEGDTVVVPQAVRTTNSGSQGSQSSAPRTPIPGMMPPGGFGSFRPRT